MQTNRMSRKKNEIPEAKNYTHRTRKIPKEHCGKRSYKTIGEDAHKNPALPSRRFWAKNDWAMPACYERSSSRIKKNPSEIGSTVAQDRSKKA